MWMHCTMKHEHVWNCADKHTQSLLNLMAWMNCWPSVHSRRTCNDCAKKIARPRASQCSAIFACFIRSTRVVRATMGDTDDDNNDDDHHAICSGQNAKRMEQTAEQSAAPYNTAATNNNIIRKQVLVYKIFSRAYSIFIFLVQHECSEYKWYRNLI